MSEQQGNLPQCWKTQDKIRLHCWSRRTFENSIGRSSLQISWRSHCSKRNQFTKSLHFGAQIWFRCFKQWKYRMQRQQWKHEKKWRRYRHVSWRKSETKMMWLPKQGMKAKKWILRHWWISVIWRILSWSHNFKKTKGRVVLRGDIMKDDSGSCAVFIEQGSSASKMTVAKIMEVISRLPRCSGQAADAISVYTQVKMEDALSLVKIPKSECPDFCIRLPNHKWPKSWSSMEDPVVFLEENLYGHFLAGLLRERQFGKVLLKKVGRNFQIRNVYSLTERKAYSCLCMWTI